jgi:hypothetical protein
MGVGLWRCEWNRRRAANRVVVTTAWASGVEVVVKGTGV